MRQPHPELNFRMGKGRRMKPKDRVRGLIEAMRLVGMTDEQIAEQLRELQKKRGVR